MQTERTPAQQLLRACAGTAAVAGVWGACKQAYKLAHEDEQPAWMLETRSIAKSENKAIYHAAGAAYTKPIAELREESNRLEAEIQELSRAKRI